MKSNPKKLYFAYGSNMNMARLQMRVGAVKRVATVKLAGYQLLFNVGMPEGTTCFANVHKTGRDADYVEGVIYELSSKQMKMLDRFEILYNKVIESFKGKPLYIYMCINDMFIHKGRKPTNDYLNHILQGAKENSLTATYNMIYNTINHDRHKLYGV